MSKVALIRSVIVGFQFGAAWAVNLVLFFPIILVHVASLGKDGPSHLDPGGSDTVRRKGDERPGKFLRIFFQGFQQLRRFTPDLAQGVAASHRARYTLRTRNIEL